MLVMKDEKRARDQTFLAAEALVLKGYSLHDKFLRYHSPLNLHSSTTPQP